MAITSKTIFDTEGFTCVKYRQDVKKTLSLSTLYSRDNERGEKLIDFSKQKRTYLQASTYRQFQCGEIYEIVHKTI